MDFQLPVRASAAPQPPKATTGGQQPLLGATTWDESEATGLLLLPQWLNFKLFFWLVFPLKTVFLVGFPTKND